MCKSQPSLSSNKESFADYEKKRYVLAEGFGEWDNTVTNPGNPQRRDTVWVQAAKDKDTPAYVVLQFDQDSPGVWPFHCTYHLPPLDLFYSSITSPDLLYTHLCLLLPSSISCISPPSP